MRTCGYCGRATEGRHEQCKGCNAPLPAILRASPTLAPSYYSFDYEETYAGKVDELGRQIDGVYAEIGRTLLGPILVMKRK